MNATLTPALTIVIICFASLCSGVTIGVFAYIGLTAVANAVRQTPERGEVGP